MDRLNFNVVQQFWAIAKSYWSGDEKLNLNMVPNAYEFIPFVLPALVVAPAIFAGVMKVSKVSEAQGKKTKNPAISVRRPAFFQVAAVPRSDRLRLDFSWFFFCRCTIASRLIDSCNFKESLTSFVIFLAFCVAVLTDIRAEISRLPGAFRSKQITHRLEAWGYTNQVRLRGLNSACSRQALFV